MTKIDRLDMLIKYYADGKSGIFAEKLEVKPSTISSWKARNTFDIELIFAKCKNINPIWLLSREGNMILSTPPQILKSPTESSSNNETLRYLMDKVESQAKEIGRLETTVEQLRSEIKKRSEIDALNAAISSIANVG